MNKKDLKMYEAPVLEVIELESEIVLLAGSDIETNAENVNTESGSEGSW